MTLKEKKLIEEFIEWARNCGEDIFFVFEYTDEAIDIFSQQRDYDDC